MFSNRTVVVGDRIYTDVKSKLNAGIVGIPVLGGQTTLKSLNRSSGKALSGAAGCR